ncbi:neuromedin-S [Microcaecilia unicolor]|uniref:Neuromedin-S n=1 Tax=Microcaecilia unicolor TaxID=1415580 RepID=A0A6P7XXG7_9AMPH|nr:neuromedin-S [Microcaecilia unicolor]
MDLCSSIFNSLQGNEENNQEIVKRFLFHYSRAQDPTYPLKTGSAPVHPLMRLASKLSQRRMKRFLDPDNTGTLGRPFFLFRPRNGRKVEDDVP